jgi:hypothetical protein
MAMMVAKTEAANSGSQAGMGFLPGGGFAGIDGKKGEGKQRGFFGGTSV